MTLRHLFGIKTRQERYDPLPDSMSDDERLIVSATIRRFLDDTIGDHDWDWMLTAPKMSKEAERISEFCSGIDFIFPAIERHKFTSDIGEAALGDLLTIIEDGSHRYEDVCTLIDALNTLAEQNAAGQPATRPESK